MVQHNVMIIISHIILPLVYLSAALRNQTRDKLDD